MEGKNPRIIISFGGLVSRAVFFGFPQIRFPLVFASGDESCFEEHPGVLWV